MKHFIRESRVVENCKHGGIDRFHNRPTDIPPFIEDHHRACAENIQQKAQTSGQCQAYYDITMHSLVSLALAVRPFHATTIHQAHSRIDPNWDFSDTPGFHLQTSDSLSPPAWANAASGATHPVTIPITGPMKFYRLVQP
jgi:hypothetical protein